MKKTQIVTLKFLYSGSECVGNIYNHLHKIFPEKKTGINLFNIEVMLRSLERIDYVKLDKSDYTWQYYLTPKGKEYVLKLKQWGVNNDK